MASIKTKFTVGLFIAIGMAITIVAIIWLGMSKYLEKGQLYVAYFDESIQGLDKDSPVKYRGVSVGRVKSVGVAPDGTLVQVIMKIETKLEPEIEKESLEDIVAQLKSIGITGIMFLELDRKKKSAPDLSPKLTFEPKYPVIATRPSEIKLFIEGVNDVLIQLKSLDGKELTDKARATIGKIDRTVDDIQIKEISADIRTTLNNINRILTDTQLPRMVNRMDSAARSAASLIGTAQDTIKRFDNMLAANEKGIDTAVGEINRVIQNANNTVTLLDQIVSGNKQELMDAISGFNRSIKNLESLLTEGRRLVKQGDSTFSELQPRLLVIMQQLEITVDNLKSFSENIADQPSQLLFGEPPAARQTEPETFQKQ
jgi:phospholipid/cholesterol/gamma-HCH transport system substrate-binding protein